MLRSPVVSTTRPLCATNPDFSRMIVLGQAIRRRAHTMHFRLSYVTCDFAFADKQISVSDPDKKIEVVYRRRLPTDEPPPFEKDDGLIIATCERELTKRLHEEAIATGILSRNKEAVKTVYDEMYSLILRTLRLARWRTNSSGGPNPIRMGTVNYFTWSLDGSEWKFVADSMSLRITMLPNPEGWTSEAEEFVRTEALGELDEPLGHELLREASTNRKDNLRSALVLAVAAAEIGFKQFASRALPDAAWLLELPSPPLIEMLAKFPWSKLKVGVNGKVLTIPVCLIDELKKAVYLRNKIVHSGDAELKSETVDSALDSVRDLLYLFDAFRDNGQVWALKHISPAVLSGILGGA